MGAAVAKTVWKSAAPIPERKYSFRNVLAPTFASSLGPKITRLSMLKKRCPKLPCRNMYVTTLQGCRNAVGG